MGAPGLRWRPGSATPPCVSESGPPDPDAIAGHASQQVVDERVRLDIEQFGWHAALIPGEGATPGWAVSVGLHQRFEHPELLIFGPDLPSLNDLLTHLARMVIQGRRFEADEEATDVLEGQRVGFRKVERKWYAPFLGNAAWHYQGDEFPVLQCFWPDPAGHLPWDPGADPEWRGDQPLLFHKETHLALSETLTDVLRREGAL